MSMAMAMAIILAPSIPRSCPSPWFYKSRDGSNSKLYQGVTSNDESAVVVGECLGMITGGMPAQRAVIFAPLKKNGIAFFYKDNQNKRKKTMTLKVDSEL